MKITSSYGMKLTGDSKALENSIRIYRDALHFVIPIVNTHWDEVTDFEYSNQRMMYVEKLVHSTSKSQARYNFDEGNFLNSLHIYVGLYSISLLVSSPLIVVT